MIWHFLRITAALEEDGTVLFDKCDAEVLACKAVKLGDRIAAVIALCHKMTFMCKIFLDLIAEEIIIGNGCDKDTNYRRYDTHIKQVQIYFSFHITRPYPACSQHYKENQDEPFVGSGNLRTEARNIRELEKRIRDLEEENAILKKSGSHLCTEPKDMRFRFIYHQKDEFRIAKMAEVLKVTVRGYYSWLKRLYKEDDSPKIKIKEIVRKVFPESNCVYGSRKIAKVIIHDYGITVNHKRVAAIMQKENIISKSSRKYKATTNSKHSLPVADNILNRDFTSARPNMKMVSDITYIPTDEGWLYVAAVMDLCGRKIVGMSMDSTMTKQLTIEALKDTVNHSGNLKGCILHSDRGSQYCSIDYQNFVHANGFIISMSRKGNCWDNAPME